MVRRAHEKGQWHLEDIRHLARMRRDGKAGPQKANHRHNTIGRRRQIGIEITHRFDKIAGNTGFLFRLAQSRRRRAFITGVDAPAGKGDLPGMA